MKNNKGQALVEFIIVLPILLLIIISIVDFGNIISKKYSLENDIDTISNLYMEEKYDEINEYASEKNISINYKKDNDLLVITLNKDVNVISPLISIVTGKTYKVSTEKSIYSE